ncbi:MAG: zinc ribbon domain-containing protein, partial [Lachnospiraceae bacterium]|nr:zinc ribbon domain-containing protein [Lachnospiraceae bacterium]
MSDTSWNTTPWDNDQGTTGEASKFCPNCGEKIPVNAAFCP